MRQTDIFEEAVKRMPVLLKELVQRPLLPRDSLGDIPEQGIYVFYENERPLYVGRSRKLRQRILEQGRPSGGRYTATFAFLIAIEGAKRSGVKPTGKPTRSDWEKDKRFAKLFAAAKDRVRGMEVRVANVHNGIEQTLFEVYAAVQLGTIDRYNDFETH